MNLYELEKLEIQKDKTATIFICLLNHIKNIIYAIPPKKIFGPPEYFRKYFRRVFDYINDIFELIDSNFTLNDEILLNTTNYNINDFIYNKLEISINRFYENFNDNNFIKTCSLIYNKIEYLYMILHFFEFPSKNINTNYYKINDYNKYNMIKIESKIIYIDKNCISNLQFLNFVINNGYTKNTYWSDAGKKWLMDYKKKIPYFWKYINDSFYVMKFNKFIPIESIFNSPIENISYFEAEAYCNYKNVSLLDDKHINIIKNYKEFNFGYVWEWTKSTSKFSKCYGGSFYTKLVLENINDWKNINKSAQHYFTGFRTIKTNI